MTQDMKDLFFIIKGQYKKGETPSFNRKEDNTTVYIGGYNPYSEDTTEWYMAVDNKTFSCIGCGKDLNTVLGSVYNTIKHYKGDAKRYFKHLSDTTTEDYYDTHYLGKRPLSSAQKSKIEGKCVGVSRHTKTLFGEVFNTYGDFYRDYIEEVEERAYNDLRGERPFNKSMKLVKKHKDLKKEGVVEKREEKVLDTTEIKGPHKTKVMFGVKKLKTT